MPLIPPGAVGLKFWSPTPVDKRTRNAWNVEDRSANVELSNGDKTATIATAVSAGVRSTTLRRMLDVGKYYIEFLCNTTSSNLNFSFQFTTTSLTTNPQPFSISQFNGNISSGPTPVGSIGSAVVATDVVCIAVDTNARLIWGRKNNGLWNNNAAADPATGTNGISAGFSGNFCLWIGSNVINASATLHTELADFTYSVPSGFTSWMGEEVPAVTGTGELAGQEAAVSGSDTAGSAEATGTGDLAADAAAVSGSGVSASVATGTLAVQAATAAGIGVSESSGEGTLAAQAATASGAGAVASVGTGALAAQAASAVAGAGLSDSVGTGALQAAAAAVVGAGISSSTGTGSLVAGSAEVAGAGTAAAANSGTLVAQDAAVSGVGLSASTGIGALVAGPVTVTGEGVVLEESAVVGIGALVAGAATLSGEGEVTGEVAPPVSAAIGGHWRPEPHRPPPVEGIGYAILPRLEGEAHGLVVVTGVGAALPRISGVGTGAAGVAGHSAATLATVKAAAVGTRGQAGAAHAVLKAAAASGSGVAGAYGTAAGRIQLKGSAVGRYDDDEAAILALLAA